MNEQIVNDVFSVYEVLKDSIKVTKRSINQEMQILHNRTLFLGEQKDIMLSRMTNVETELDDIMALSLFASFERELRISLQAIIDNNTNKINSTLIRLTSLTIDSIERWTVSDMINALEDIVLLETRSKTKQICEYRNWVAHGKNRNKLPSIQTDTKTVQVTLLDFMIQAKRAI